MKVTKDLIEYIEHIDELSGSLNDEQRKELENIMVSILKLFVGFKKGTNLGNVGINFTL